MKALKTTAIALAIFLGCSLWVSAGGGPKIVTAPIQSWAKKTLTITGQWIFSNIDVNGGAIDGTPIGAATPSTGAFTTLTASGLVSIPSTLVVTDGVGGATVFQADPSSGVSMWGRFQQIADSASAGVTVTQIDNSGGATTFAVYGNGDVYVLGTVTAANFTTAGTVEASGIHSTGASVYHLTAGSPVETISGNTEIATTNSNRTYRITAASRVLLPTFGTDTIGDTLAFVIDIPTAATGVTFCTTAPDTIHGGNNSSGTSTYTNTARRGTVNIRILSAASAYTGSSDATLSYTF